MTELSTTANRADQARKVLSYAAWAMLLWVVVGYLSTVPAIDAALTAAEVIPAVRVAVGAFLIVVLVTALTLWGAALWHAISDPQRHLLPRVPLILLLTFGNFVAAFFYYFVFVRRLPRHARQSSPQASIS